MTHPASLLALKAGKVDVAATMQRLVAAYEKSGKLAKGDVRILWVSPNIPNQPVAVRQ
jgi:ABC-type phosphate/phosphonate transport system substrate-binding protein